MPATILGSCVLKWNPPCYEACSASIVSRHSRRVYLFAPLVRSFSRNCLALPPPPPPSLPLQKPPPWEENPTTQTSCWLEPKRTATREGNIEGRGAGSLCSY